ncbi:MAG: hypothetical protein F6K54_09550 [Okeania sp. SIO3B5]|uniref:hypothetical protein n=1 Tax=Okeania sp. SIO3B5 TaxID=2607811 RepID=UPI0014007703|nr:hypothetical protein [Okeania sp. SIO3B5]NEO53302.1 hypothetical protein [Okeania sp. SIO3B5]
MNFVRTNQQLLKLGLLTMTTFFLYTFSAKVLAYKHNLETEKGTILLTELPRNNRRVCLQRGTNWSEVNYFESKNYFANICRQPNGQLMLIAGRKSNPTQVLELPVEFNQGYAAIDGNKTFRVNDGSFSLAINGLVVKREEITYQEQ